MEKIMRSRNRISVQLEGTQLAAMQQYLSSTKQKKGKRLIKIDNIDNITHDAVKQLTKERACSVTSVMREAVTFQLNAMSLAIAATNGEIFPKCSASAFMAAAAKLYTSFETDKQRENFLLKIMATKKCQECINAKKLRGNTMP